MNHFDLMESLVEIVALLTDEDILKSLYGTRYIDSYQHIIFSMQGLVHEMQKDIIPRKPFTDSPLISN